MASDRADSASDTRDLVRLSLLDHASPLGKATDTGVLGLDAAFVAVFVAQTYPVSEPAGELLWRLEVPIAAAFLLEYVLCLYDAPDRWATRFTPHTVLDLVAGLPTVRAVSLPGSSAAAEAEVSARSESARFLRSYRDLPVVHG